MEAYSKTDRGYLSVEWYKDEDGYFYHACLRETHALASDGELLPRTTPQGTPAPLVYFGTVYERNERGERTPVLDQLKKLCKDCKGYHAPISKGLFEIIPGVSWIIAANEGLFSCLNTKALGVVRSRESIRFDWVHKQYATRYLRRIDALEAAQCLVKDVKYVLEMIREPETKEQGA